MSLNEATLKFLEEFGKNVTLGQIHTNDELVELFQRSTHYDEIFKTYGYTKGYLVGD